VIHGLVPNKPTQQLAEGLPPIFTLRDEKTLKILKQIKDLGAIEGCKIFYLTSADIK
jgi:hypothetical protein